MWCRDSGEEGKTAPSIINFDVIQWQIPLRFVIPWFIMIPSLPAGLINVCQQPSSSRNFRCKCFKPDRCDLPNANLLQSDTSCYDFCLRCCFSPPKNVSRGGDSRSYVRVIQGHWCSLMYSSGKSSRNFPWTNGILSPQLCTTQLCLKMGQKTHPNFGKFHSAIGKEWWSTNRLWMILGYATFRFQTEHNLWTESPKR